MSHSGLGVSRFLSKREKHHVGRHHGAAKAPAESSPQNIEGRAPLDFHGLFRGPEKAVDINDEPKMKILRRKLMEKKGVVMTDSHILYALHTRFAHGDIDDALDLLLAMSDSSEGLIRDYDPHVKLLGAVNREAVTCYLDTVLFSIFSRLDSFEAMLYNTFDDGPRCRLALLLRLWVNLLRSGKLITTDITRLIQHSLAECGWSDAARLDQQDASEAFTFITERLQLPLLTLKMDLYHTGKGDVDDHKFINERLLEVAIPSDSSGEVQTVTLEDCLESYFNNRVEVRRYLERRTTLSSVKSHESSFKADAVHVETVEVGPDFLPITPMSNAPGATSASRPTKHRAPSIIQQRFIPDEKIDANINLSSADAEGPGDRTRKGSVRREVVMPAWQFFSLIPWYTDSGSVASLGNDQGVAAHFSSKRPVLGLCLKRYAITPEGKAIRLNTKIDIPVEIGLPHFIQDDHMQDDGPLHGNFKLSLQSVVCHRGNSVSAGHYIALVRGTNTAIDRTSAPAEDTKHWLRFDDLASKRITLVDIEQALQEETPYLLFYQIVPIDGDPGRITEGEQVPGYASSEATGSIAAGRSTASLTTAPLSLRSTREDLPPSGRPSSELAVNDSPRGRSPKAPQPEERRASITFEEAIKTSGGAAAGDPSSSKPNTRPNSQNRRGSLHGRTSSQASDMLARSLSRLSMTGRRSKEALLSTETPSAPKTEQQPAGEAPTQPKHTLPVPRQETRRERSKNRSKNKGKSKAERPDRECSVM